MSAAALVSSLRTTVAAACGVTDDLFGGPGRCFDAELVIDRDALPPAGTSLLQRGRTVPVLVRFAPPEGEPMARTVAIKVRDAYGVGADQDFLLASSLDGIPWHHAVVPRTSASGLYSSLWLYLAGLRPVVFGARVPELGDRGPGRGDQVSFLVASAVSRFNEFGTISLGEEVEDAALHFAASNCGAGLQALPPARWYAG